MLCMFSVCTWCKTHGTWKHNGHERGDQSFFSVCVCMCSFPFRGLCSQLSHSCPEFDQYVKPDTDKAPCSGHERLHKHCGTHAYSRKHTFTHTSSYNLFCFGHKSSNTQAIHTLQQPPPSHHCPPTPLSTPPAFALRLPFISIMEKKKAPVQDCLWHLYHLSFLKVPTNLSTWQNPWRCPL